MQLFTTEQMTGSGQTNMLDLIRANEERIEQLRRTPHTIWSDPSHAWLEVEKADLIILDIEGLISRSSYRNGDKVYLEEDVDAALYMIALFGKNGERTPQQTAELEQWLGGLIEIDRDNIFIRNLKPFTK